MNSKSRVSFIIDGSYKLRIQDDNDAFADFELTLDDKQPEMHLYNIINEVNVTLRDIVETNATAAKYSDSIKIPADVCEHDLRQIAMMDLFRRIFLEGKTTDEAEQIKRDIKQFLRNPSKVQVTIIGNQNFFFPWALIYDGDTDNLDTQNVDRNSFWGFKHIFEQIPTPPNGKFRYPPTVDSPILLSFNFNKYIDEVYKVGSLQLHRDFFDNIANPGFQKLRTRETGDEILEAFKSDIDEDLLYFWCHAQSATEIGALETDTYMLFTGQADHTPENELTLQKLKTLARRGNFIKAPLVFINACESAKMSSLFYDGFISYFMSKKSRGVIGTLSKVPAIFAANFAVQFFEMFLKGNPTGKIVLELRKKYLEQSNNLLGLYYVAYCPASYRLTSPILI